MTESEVLEFNKKCADYLKLELTGPGFPSGYFYNDSYYHFEDLKFHCDWNWLMELKNKICSEKYVDEFETIYDSVLDLKYRCNILFVDNNFKGIFTKTFKTEKEAVLDAIKLFLEHNETRTS